jgi:hypothetical protein
MSIRPVRPLLSQMSSINYNRALLCHLSADQYQFVFEFSVRHGITMSRAVTRMIRLARVVDAMPDASQDEAVEKQAGRSKRERR